MVKFLYLFLAKLLLRPVYETYETSAPITIRGFLIQKVLRINGAAYWPMHFTSKASGVRRIKIGIGTAPGLSPGCYIQGVGEVWIGDYTLVGPNVGIISGNHDLEDPAKHVRGKVNIGRYCWLGMGAIILPGVTLGDHTVVAAGAVVTKSFPEGCCVIGGNPARLIKELDSSKFRESKNKYEYVGYVKGRDFEKFRRKRLDI